MTAPLRIAGDTHIGKVRTTNEDALIVEPRLGLYAVLDGMGGANAGDVASQLARDAIREFVHQRAAQLAPRQLLEAAIIAGSAAVFAQAQGRPERHGMGTTVVACLVVKPTRVVIGHVGDSRAYLLRGGRLQALTRDHTIVEELLGRGLLTVEEAQRHPYKNVLSRNLGARSEAKVDTVEVDLAPGDRVLLCSDGLYGYASAEAIQYLLGSGDAPEHVAHDLVELALRGGGGDNVSTIVLEAPQSAPSSTQVVRSSGSQAWWKHRQRFVQLAETGGLVRNPIVRGLPAKEALELVALSLCQAIYHDLEKSTGVNVWTFAQNLATAWFERGGDWQAVRGIVDILSAAAHQVVDDIRSGDAPLGFLLDVAVSRALIVVELALGGLLGERLRQIDRELVELQTSGAAATTGSDTLEEPTLESLEVPETVERFIERPVPVPPAVPAAPAAKAPSPSPSSAERFNDRATLPFLRPDRPNRPVPASGEAAEVHKAIGQAITLARGQLPPRAELVAQILIALEAIATSGDAAAEAVHAARELYGVRTVDNSGVMPLYDALDRARILTAASVHQLRAAVPIRVRALRALSTAHQRLVGATTGLVLEAVAPFSERLREVQAVTGELRDAVASAERRRADLEHQFATVVDLNLPWGARGTTEW